MSYTYSKSVSTRRTTMSVMESSKKSSRRTTYSCTTEEAGEREFPMFMAMTNLWITPTGFTDAQTRNEICSKVQTMCGDVSFSLTTRTTHVVAAHANTTKVQMAKDRKIRVMPLEWVDNLWNACQQHNPYVHASFPELQMPDCPLFYNLHFVLSEEFENASVKFCENLILEHGGLIDVRLKNSPLTYFYICHFPEGNAMYQYAIQRKIPCVTYSWLIESVSTGMLVPPEDFDVRNSPFAKAQVSDRRSRTRRSRSSATQEKVSTVPEAFAAAEADLIDWNAAVDSTVYNLIDATTVTDSRNSSTMEDLMDLTLVDDSNDITLTNRSSLSIKDLMGVDFTGSHSTSQAA